jgi:hypothetical protein
MKTRVLQLLVFMFMAVVGHAQVTTSSMGGKVTDAKGDPLIGATVVAVHTPSGTTYGTITSIDGSYDIVGMRAGGPYTVSISYVGYETVTQSNIFIRLGESFDINAQLQDDGVQLDQVEISAIRSNIMNSNRTGAATNLNADQINALPTISRSINDFTRLTPQAQSGNGFGGRDGRYNNIQIDGANFNNNFGLSSNNLPGGGSQPISLDAIEQIQVNIAPYDVRQSNFTGAGINAITRSGTNNMEGSVYTLYRDETFNGYKVGDAEVPVGDKTQSLVWGARLGGAIVKNKLFYFVNFEKEDNTRPGINIIPSAPGRTGDNISRTTLEDMETVRNFVKERYNYDTGRPDGYASNFNTKNTKALARIDWNISNKHKMTLRYNQVIATDDQVVNGTSAPNPRSASNRVSLNSFAFENANYGFENSVRSLTAELNSNFSSKLSNQLLVTYTSINDRRTSKSDVFPFIDIKKDGDAYMSLGYELFSWQNEVRNNVTTFTNNLTYKMGMHNITAGAAFDYLTFGNSFQRYGTSYYRYSSMDDFLNNRTPEAFGLTFSVLPDGRDPFAELNFGLGSLYLQDEIRVNDKLKLTAGLRMDIPFYFNKLETNPAVNALDFRTIDGQDGYKIDLAQWPNSKPLFSPRLGFNYDVKGDRTLQLRGGTGIFTGRVPFVWFTNLPTNSGMLQNTIERVGQSVEDLGITFNPDPKAWVDKFPSSPGTVAPGSIASIDPNFRLPQIWRTNFAMDYQLPQNTIFTLEAIYGKDINAITQFNANQTEPVGNMNAANGQDTRPFFGATNANRRVNPNMAEAMVLTNAREGYSMSLTAMLSKEFSKGISAMVAYTYTEAKDISGNPGSQAASAWSGNPAVRGHNDLDLDPAAFAVPHRVIGSFTYSLEYLGLARTNVGLFYEGAHQGRFSYRYTADFNRDGINADLIYIPANPGEITFTDVVVGGNVQFTAQQQSDAFFSYIEQDSYLSKNQGKYAERNGALLPWRNRFDFRVTQDFFVNLSGKKYTVQLSGDILNFSNLLSSKWGTRQLTNYNNGAILVPRVNADGTATYQMARVNNQLATDSYRDLITTAGTWGAQLGLRFIF